MKYSVILIGFFCWLINASCQSTMVDPQAFNKLLSDTTVQKLDVRTKAEFEIVGHIPAFSQISITDKNFDQKILQQFDPNRPIMVTCFSGHRSIDAVKRLEKLGFKKLYELKGGLINWMEKGFELE